MSAQAPSCCEFAITEFVNCFDLHITAHWVLVFYAHPPTIFWQFTTLCDSTGKTICHA